MNRFLQFSVIALLSCSSMTPAFAQELDDNGKQLKAMFEKIIEDQKKLEFGPSSVYSSLVFDGDVNVEQSGKYYAVTLPHMTLQYPDGAKFEIGMVAINAAPHDDPDQWKMTFALPTPMTLTDENGEKTMQMKIGGQSASGVWNDTLGYFSKLDANYENIEFSDPENTYKFSMPNVRAVYDLDSDEEGKWSGPVYFTFDETNMNIPEEGGEVLRIGSINFNMEMFKYNPANMDKYQEQIQKLALLQTDDAEGEAPAPDIDVATMIDTFVSLMGDGFTSQYQLKDIMIKGDREENKFETLKIADAGFGFDMTGFLSNKVALDLRMGYQGFEMLPPPAGVPDIAPKNFNMDFSLQNIPFKEITDMGKNTAEAAMANPQMAQMAGMSVLFKLPALLSEAGTTLVMKDNHFGNDAYHVQIDGEVLTDIEAVNTATADVTGSIKGMDKLTQSLNAEMQANPTGPNASFIQQALMVLTMAKGFGEISTNENGEPVHMYKFIMNKEGQMLLNGQDMKMLMGGAAGGAPQIQLEQP